SSIDFILFEIHGWWLNVIAFLAIVWLTNLYNFLDGIDGYAGTEAVMVGLGLFLFFHYPLGLVIVAASLGFLLFNWHQASIFMGDIGSTTLGFIFAVFVFFDTSHGNIYVWLILLSLFWFDATLTLIRRYRNGEKITQAHKKHAYQRLTQSGWGHDKVVLFSIGFNLIFLVLLYFMENVWIVFILNIIALYTIMKLIDTKKSFI
ncbi:MAG: glycosyl transferase, partial [Sulfurovum sp.]|nr:glycosyl transferase [Sulfurovum sp.]NNJ44890.1 glycosyl transferase [Sulfurovum sp.]